MGTFKNTVFIDQLSQISETKPSIVLTVAEILLDSYTSGITFRSKLLQARTSPQASLAHPIALLSMQQMMPMEIFNNNLKLQGTLWIINFSPSWRHSGEFNSYPLASQLDTYTTQLSSMAVHFQTLHCLCKLHSRISTIIFLCRVSIHIEYFLLRTK